MPVLLVRHGVAVARKLWPGEDAARPLDERGRLQAVALVDRLETDGDGRIRGSYLPPAR